MLTNLVRLLHPGKPGGLSYAGYLLGALSLAGGVFLPTRTSTTTIQQAAPVHQISTFAPPTGQTFAPPKQYGLPSGGVVNGTLQVRNVFTRDTHVNISADINAAAKAYGFNPVGYVALMGTESDIHQYAPHYPIAGAGACDYSGGLVQITVCTAAGYPLFIGDGSESQANINYVFWYEQQNASRMVWAGAKLLAYFKGQVCWDFPTLYTAWNMGPGYGCFSSVYINPGGFIAHQAWVNYEGWWNYSWANYAYYKSPPAPPKPYVFPWRSWCGYLWAHRKPCPTPWANKHGGLNWPASIFVRERRKHHIGGFVTSKWVSPRRGHKHGYNEYFWATGSFAVAWPSFHTYEFHFRR